MNPVTVLHEQGLKVTPVRKAILQILSGAKRPISCEEIFERLKGRHDLATVYRNLNTFSLKGLVARTDLGGERSCFEIRVGQKHRHHVVCTQCHAVTPISMCGLDPQMKAVKDLGFTKIEHRLEFYGRCKRCS